MFRYYTYNKKAITTSTFANYSYGTYEYIQLSTLLKNCKVVSIETWSYKLLKKKDYVLFILIF